MFSFPNKNNVGFVSLHRALHVPLTVLPRGLQKGEQCPIATSESQNHRSTLGMLFQLGILSHYLEAGKRVGPW